MKRHSPPYSSKVRLVKRLSWAVYFVTMIMASPNVVAREIVVRSGGDLQQAISQAQLGDDILLENGATFVGNFYLMPKFGSGWIQIRPQTITNLPRAGFRITSQHIPSMPKLISANFNPTLSTIGAAHHYRIVGLDISVKQGTWHWATVAIGSASERALEDLPHNIELDRVFIHGDPNFGSVRGVALNGRNVSVKGSLIQEYKRPDYDCQAIAIWNTPGPVLIENNQLEASSENIMLGGGTPSIPGMVPSDIVIRRNYIRKPLSWRVGDPSFAGATWSVKNLFEIKMGRRVTFDSNVLENVWQSFQLGFAFVFTVRTEGGFAPQAVIEDVTITNNIVRRAACVLSALGIDNIGGGNGMGRSRRILIRDNIFTELGGPLGCGGRTFMIQNGAESYTIDHNTVMNVGGSLIVAAGLPSPSLRFTNNLVSFGDYGFVGDGVVNGDPVLKHYFPNLIMEKNIIFKPYNLSSVPNNYFLYDVNEVKFTFPSILQLDAVSAARFVGTDGKPVGADAGQVYRYTAGVVQGNPAAFRR